MNSDERRFEALVASVFTDATPTPPPVGLLEDAIDVASQVRRYPRWLADLKEPPMHTDSHLAVGSPTLRVGAILLATFLLAVALAAVGTAGARLLAADGLIVVAQDGSGSYTTISEAVAAAADGDEIVVRPGRYVETVAIDKDITVRGDDNDPSAVVIEIPGEAPLVPGGIRCGMGCNRMDETHSYGVYLAEVVGGLSNLTVQRLPGHIAIVVHGGEPLLENLVIDIAGGPGDSSFNETRDGLWIDHGSRARVTGVTHVGWLTVDHGSSPIIEDNRFIGTCIAVWGEATTAVFRDNVVETCPNDFGFDIAHGATPLIEGNEIRGGLGWASIIVDGRNDGSATNPQIRANTIEGAGRGIIVQASASATVERNRLTDNLTGVMIQQRSEATVRGNAVSGGTDGIVVGSGSSAAIEGNTIRGASGTGLTVLGGSEAVIQGNTACDNEVNVSLDEDAEVILGNNEICEDLAVG